MICLRILPLVLLTFISSYAGKWAHLVGSTGAKGTEDAVLADSLDAWGITSDVVPLTTFDVTSLQGYEGVVLTQNLLNSSQVNSLLTANIPVLLISKAVTALGSVFSYSEVPLTVKINSRIMKGYPVGLGYWFTNNPPQYLVSAPAGWNMELVYAKTMPFLGVSTSSGKGVYMTLPLTSLNNRGWELVRRCFKWINGTLPLAVPSVNSGDVVLVVDASIAQNATLDINEKIVRDSLVAMGLSQIVTVGSGQVAATDLSLAKLVITTQHTIDTVLHRQLKEAGVPVLYSYLGAQTVGRAGTHTTACMGRHWPDSPVMDGYGDYTKFSYSTTDVSYLDQTTLSGWSLGLDCGNWETKLVGSTTVGNWRSAFYTIQPSIWNERGGDLFKRAVRWVQGGLAIEGRSIGATSIALVIESVDDISPTLNATEQALVHRLTAWGYQLEYVGANRVTVSDFSNALGIITTGANWDPSWTTALSQAGVPCLLLGEGFFGISDDYSSTTSSSDIIVANTSGLLSGHSLYEQISIGTGTQYSFSDVPDGWTMEAYNSKILSRETPELMIGIGQKADNLNTEGWSLVKKATEWLFGLPVIPTIPETPEVITMPRSEQIQSSASFRIFDISGTEVRSGMNLTEQMLGLPPGIYSVRSPGIGGHLLIVK